MFEILGRFTGDDERAERESCCGLSHPEYRALVMRRALKAPGSPGTRKMFKAKRDVDLALARAGVAVTIPGARPGRRTT